MGDHAISCAIGGERISKHNHVRDAIFKAAVEAGLGPIREPDGLLPGSESELQMIGQKMSSSPSGQRAEIPLSTSRLSTLFSKPWW